jgi:uncharacterized protein (TIGR02118 family)
MIKMIAATGRRPGMTHGEYIAYIRDVHAALARENPVTLRRYRQNHIFDGAYGTAAEPTHRQSTNRDSVSELYWDSFEAMGQTFAHPHTQQKVGPDGINFADSRVSLSVIATEEEVAVPNPGVGTVKVMHFLRMREDLPLSEFLERWRIAHERAVSGSKVIASAIRRCVHSRQLPEGNPLLEYFGAENNVPYEGIVSLWFENDSSIAVFREYERAMLQINECDESAFYVPAESFFVHVREVDVL